VIPVNDRNYDVNDAGTAIIHFVIPVIDRNYDIYDIMIANLSNHENYIVIQVIHLNYDIKH
jgi:hypothetical protein